MKRKEIKYSKVLKTIAKQMSELRSKLSSKIYKEGTEKHRGERESEISMLGVEAELIAMESLISKGIEADFTNIVDLKPQVEPDIRLKSGETIDVKGFKGSSFMINANSHDNPDKRPNYYWFIKPSNNFTAENYVFSSKSVTDTWTKTESTFSNIYIKRIKGEK